MIDVNELMKGDWLSLNYDINYKTGELIYAPVQITGINTDGTIDVNFTYDPSPSMQDGWDPKLFESIPLTREIFEKNGFEEKIYDFGKFGPSRDFSAFYLSDGIVIWKQYDNWIVGSNSDDFNGWFSIYYVHELQHMLKYISIIKTIKLV